jgi:hypothetical protein
VRIISVCRRTWPDLRRRCCAPSATRTRDLLLRRHSRNVASHGSAWPHVQVSRIHHDWMWLGMALCLRSLAPRLAPGISLATLRFECSGPWGPPDGDPGRHATPGRLNRPRSWRCTFLPRAAPGPTSTVAVRPADETVTSPESGRQSGRPDEPLAAMIDTGVNTAASQTAPAVVDLAAGGDRHDCRVRRMSFISSTKCRSSVGLGSNSGTRWR